ncbi:hypothetical protein T05_10228 [Trichinella murrelli]|uniref:Uncharacterized protein n=1 Tax=Trichinella murrelli TaxID=144512 RepID=A0A0V0TJZ4_9BILA|nr:hypothetical protein T05_10228 [Trichinella murrelli]
MLPTKRELGKRDGRAGSNRTDDTDAEMNLNPVEARNEPAREFEARNESGSLHRVSEVREPEDVREGDRHRHEFRRPQSQPTPWKTHLIHCNYTVHLPFGRANERLVNLYLKVCYDGPVWDDARLRHGDVTGVLELECRPSRVGGSVGVLVTPILRYCLRILVLSE